MRRSTRRPLDGNSFPLTLAFGLRAEFADFTSEPLPERLAALMRRLDERPSEDERLGEQARGLSTPDADGIDSQADLTVEPGLVAAICADMRGNTDECADGGGA